MSAFGGIVALNGEIDAAVAEEITRIFTEVIVAPTLASHEAQKIIAAKKNLRLPSSPVRSPIPRAPGITFKSLSGGLLVQSRDNGRVEDLDLKVVTQKQPTDAELKDLKLAMTVAKHVKSNAVIYVKDGATVGIGAGQMSRVDSSRTAHRKSIDAAEQAGIEGALTKGSVVASDAFFRSPTACWLQSMPAPRRSFSRAARSTTRR